jgi:hypothetical protein
MRQWVVGTRGRLGTHARAHTWLRDLFDTVVLHAHTVFNLCIFDGANSTANSAFD